MKIESLAIWNFRGIKEFAIDGLGSMVIVAGPNGSGKSCIFDGIRLLKSVYGGYQKNEWQQWMGEFQITLSNRSSDFLRMFNDPQSELRIRAEFRLSEEERAYISSNAGELLKESIWRTILPDAFQWGGYRMAVFASQFREREPEVAQKAAEKMPGLLQELAAPTIHGECFIPVGGVPQFVDSTSSKPRPLWDELIPAEQARIVGLLVERVDISGESASIRLRAEGLSSLALQLRGCFEVGVTG